MPGFHKVLNKTTMPQTDYQKNQESKMERNKDYTIVFQNQSHLIQKHFNDRGVCPTLFDIALATDLMVEYIFKGPTTEIKDRLEKFEKHIEELKTKNK